MTDRNGEGFYTGEARERSPAGDAPPGRVGRDFVKPAGMSEEEWQRKLRETASGGEGAGTDLDETQASGTG